MNPLPQLGKEILPWGESKGTQALRHPESSKLMIYNVANSAQRPAALFSRSGSWFGTKGEQEQLNKRYVNSLGEPVDYDPSKHHLDEENQVWANYKFGQDSFNSNPNHGTLGINPNRSFYGAMARFIGSSTNLGGESDFASRFERTKLGTKREQESYDQANADYLRQYPQSSADYTAPAEGVRAATKVQTPVSNSAPVPNSLTISHPSMSFNPSMLTMEYNPARDNPNAKISPIGAATPQNQINLGYDSMKSQNSPLKVPSSFASMPLPSEMIRGNEAPQAQALGNPWQGSQKSALSGMDPNKMSQSQYMNSRGTPTAAQFDDYINQSLQDPNSSINAGLASMRNEQNKNKKRTTYDGGQFFGKGANPFA